MQLDTSEKRILLFTAVPVLFLMYEYLYPNSMYNNPDAYNDIELTVGNILLYTTVIFSMIWLVGTVKSKRPSSIAILIFAIIPTAIAYVNVAFVLLTASK